MRSVALLFINLNINTYIYQLMALMAVRIASIYED